MGFQIQTEAKVPIAINDLDREAAEFWGNEVHPKQYATPEKITEDMDWRRKLMAEMRGNWFDIIGYAINSPLSRYTNGWGNVKCTLWTIQAQGWYDLIGTDEIEGLQARIKSVKAYLKPYFDLIDHWASKGYIPAQIPD